MTGAAGPLHSLKQTDKTETFYPAHPPRVATDVYVRSHHSLTAVKNTPCWACSITYQDCSFSGLKAKLAGRAMETHHFWCEDAFTGEGEGLGGIYWPRIMADHPTFDWAGSGFQLGDPATWKQFVDSEFNLQVLCSAPETPVLIADGSWMPIAEVRVGDLVVGGDMTTRRVTATASRSHVGSLVIIDGVRLTPEHPVLTDRGWLPAGEVTLSHQLREVGMLGSDVVAMGRVEAKVLSAVISLDPIDVMNDLGGEKGPAELRFHHDSMFAYLLHPALARIPASDHHISALNRTLTGSSDRGSALTGLAKERRHPAGVGAEDLHDMLGSLGLDAALLAYEPRGVLESDGSLSFATATRAAGEGRSDRGVDLELARAMDADAALAGGRTPAKARWRPVRKISRESHDGRVYDLEVEGARSFVAGGFVVHNCSACHRAARPVPHWLAGQADPARGGIVWLPTAGSMGIHHASYPEYRDQRHNRPDAPPFQVPAAGLAQPKVPPHVMTLADAAAAKAVTQLGMAGHVFQSS